MHLKSSGVIRNALFYNCVKGNQNENPIHEKSIEHFSLPDNTSSSDYSSGPSLDMSSKQIICSPREDSKTNYTTSIRNQYDRRFGLNNETSYLPSIPISLLTNRLSTFRYPVPSNEINLSYEQNQQLLQKTLTHEDDHQYYEIG
ncbi:unnamed protein product [Rotaria magnacalcarata]|uniref:Uncharacterized protein n=1 Tax=Rotaria magnacalcarata TaxID=392030 RepID=A0A8S3FSY9_9BILA|nr:unnamed protein product [Rotaria magnacalcarata]